MKHLIALSAVLALAACNFQSPPVSTVEQQRQAAAQEAATEQTYSYEVENIKKRRLLFGKPGVIGYVVLLTEAGQPAMYLTVAGKCTSSGKRLQPTQEVRSLPYRYDNGGKDDNSATVYVTDAVGEDGVYGSSEPYVYCYTSDGRYIQWSGQYLYSDKPFDLTIKPLVIDTSAKLTAQ